MNRQDYNEMRDEVIETIFELNTKKGADYAGDEDALGNFKDAARMLGISPEQVWAVYAHKHISAIMSFCQKGQVESEPIEGRIHDVMVYCVLLLGLIEDRKAQEKQIMELQTTQYAAYTTAAGEFLVCSGCETGGTCAQLRSCCSGAGRRDA